MVNKTLLVFLGFDVLFAITGGLLFAFPIFAHSSRSKPPTLDTVAVDLLLDHCPLTGMVATFIIIALTTNKFLASTVNAIIVWITFAISLPAFFFKQNRRILQGFAAAVLCSAFLTLGIGLSIWFSTLKTRSNLVPLWNSQSSFIQSMLQFKFKCCGFDDNQVFIQDGTCKNDAVAIRLNTCQGPFAVFANQFLDVVFTTFFGLCALDGMLFLATLCVLKQRKEMARYKFIDEKRVYGSI